MKSLVNHINEVLVKRNLKADKPGDPIIFPSEENNPYFTDGTFAEDFISNLNSNSSWINSHEGELIEHTTGYLREYIHNEYSLTIDEIGEDYMAYLEQYLDIPSKDYQELIKRLEYEINQLIDLT